MQRQDISTEVDVELSRFHAGHVCQQGNLLIRFKDVYGGHKDRPRLVCSAGQVTSAFSFTSRALLSVSAMVFFSFPIKLRRLDSNLYFPCPVHFDRKGIKSSHFSVLDIIKK